MFTDSWTKVARLMASPSPFERAHAAGMREVLGLVFNLEIAVQDVTMHPDLEKHPKVKELAELYAEQPERPE